MIPFLMGKVMGGQEDQPLNIEWDVYESDSLTNSNLPEEMVFFNGRYVYFDQQRKNIVQTQDFQVFEPSGNLSSFVTSNISFLDGSLSILGGLLTILTEPTSNTADFFALTSPDGSVWTKRTLPTSVRNAYDVTQAAQTRPNEGASGMLMANATVSNTAQNYLYSENGTTWALGSVPMFGGSAARRPPHPIIQIKDLFYLSSYDYANPSGHSPVAILTSTTGKSGWTKRSMPSNRNQSFTQPFGFKDYVYIGFNSDTGTLMRSSNGTSFQDWKHGLPSYYGLGAFSTSHLSVGDDYFVVWNPLAYVCHITKDMKQFFPCNPPYENRSASTRSLTLLNNGKLFMANRQKRKFYIGTIIDNSL